jgi:hypothetical protein
VLLPEHFRDPVPHMPGWRLDVVLAHPNFRNDMFIVGTKPDPELQP